MDRGSKRCSGGQGSRPSLTAKWLSREALQIAVKRREVTNIFKGLDFIENA